MIRNLVIHEIKDYIKTKKFLIGLVLTTSLFIASVLINMSKYAETSQNYLDSLTSFQGFNDEFVLRMPPTALDIWIQGVSSQIGNRAGFTKDRIPIRTTGDMGMMSHRFFVSQAHSFDVVFVIKYIMSLFVILLAHNSISGGIENGTLRMAVANSVSRYTILIGKYIGGLVVIVYSLVIAFTISLIVVISNKYVVITKVDLARIGLLLIASILYVCVFYSFGIVTSVLVKQSQKSLVWLLEIWIVLVIVYPNMSMVLVKKYYPVQNETELSDQKKQVSQWYDEQIQNINEGTTGSADIFQKREALRAEKAEKLYQIDKEHDRTLDRQVAVAYVYSSLSPAVVFDSISNRLANNGIANYNHFIEHVYQYWRDHIRNSDLYNATERHTLPEFTYHPPGLADSVIAVSPKCLYICVIIIVCYVLAQIRFQHMEV